VLARFLPTQLLSFGEKPSSEAFSPLLMAVGEHVPEIDVPLAFGRIGGSSEALEQTLEVLARRIPEMCRRLVIYLEADDIKAFATEVHGVKGSMNNIGATEIAWLAENLEMLAKKGDSEECRNRLPELVSRIEALLAALAPVLAEAASKKPKPAQTPGDTGELKAALTEAADYLEQFETDLAAQALEAFACGAFGAELDSALTQLLESIQEFDYDTAQGMINDILGKIT
jgi:HPt (histidine-containing phosphotransfer) domain-containing protein